SPTNTIGDEKNAWQGVGPTWQLQAAAGRAARIPAAHTNARTQDEERICLLNDVPAESCTFQSKAASAIRIVSHRRGDARIRRSSRASSWPGSRSGAGARRTARP